VLACARLAIEPDETAGELSPRLAALGAALVTRELPRFLAGELTPAPQDHARATLAPLLKKEDGAVDWALPARAVHDHVRGLSPWPSAYTHLDGARIKLHRTRVGDERSAHAQPGAVLRTTRDAIEVACGQGSLQLLELQLEGGRRLAAAEFCAGHPLTDRARFTGP
jgi:methionyl-tRNA formyltransferase